MKEKMKNNPFDIIIQACIDYSRAILRDIDNYDEEYEYDCFDINIDYFQDVIKYQYKILSELSDDEIYKLKEQSIFSKFISEKFTEINGILCSIFDDIPTEYTDRYPCLSENTENTIYFDTKEDIRRKILRRIVLRDDSVSTDNLHDSILFSCLTYFSLLTIEDEHLKELVIQGYSKEKDFISKYGLKEPDIKYMISVLAYKGRVNTLSDTINKVLYGGEEI